MQTYIQYIHQAWLQTSYWEIIAVVFAIAYLILAIKESLWCWPAALISTLIYVFLFFDVNLYMESLLQIFYIVMAFYGWYQWRHGGTNNSSLNIAYWTVKNHLLAVLLLLILVSVSGTLLLNTNAAFPWLDSFTTWAAVITTWMVAKKIIENWFYWMIIDSVSIYLYIQKGLYLTSGLFFIYVILCVIGYQQWRKAYQEY